MTRSADQAAFLVVLSKGLVPQDELKPLAEQARLSATPLLSALEKRLDADALRRVVQTLARHGRTCAKCELVTYLLPKQTEADTPCEHCGGALLRESERAQTALDPGSLDHRGGPVEPSPAREGTSLEDTTVDPPRADPTKVTIPGYVVVRSLGRGGMGHVLLACDSSGQEVAVKLLRDVTKEALLLRFEREERLLKQLTGSDGFVSLLDSGQTDGGPFIVMPFLRGGTLRDRLRGTRLEPDRAVALVRALAHAMGRAHEAGLVHRDLKPENVLFDSIGRPFIADLGLAKHFRRDVPGGSASISVTKQGEMLGTKGYMPLEQRLDAQSVGPAADVFALGAILYECLAGTCPPYENRRPLAELRRDVPAPLSAIAERALAAGPTERYPDGAALARALAEAAGDTPASPGTLAVPCVAPPLDDPAPAPADPDVTYADGVAPVAAPAPAAPGPAVGPPAPDPGHTTVTRTAPAAPPPAASLAPPSPEASRRGWTALLVGIALAAGAVLGILVDRLAGLGR